MLETEPARYQVVGKHNNHLWLEVLGGEDQGIRVSVPVRHSDYNDELENKLLDLDKGDVLEVTLISHSEERPDWRVNNIEELQEQNTAALA